MKLTPERLSAFDAQGFAVFPDCLSEIEIALLRGEAHAVLKLNRAEVFRDKSGAPRSAYAPHRYNDVFALLARHPRLIEPVRQALGEDVYIHQFKLNARATFEGDIWQWHQDFASWQREDGMREPRAINVAVFLDDVMPVNGPLLLIPKSHRTETRDGVAGYPLLTLDRDTVTRLVQEAEDASGSGVVAPTGKAGTVLMFHGNLVHAVPPNITPYPRKVAYLTLNAVSNGITKFTRAEWMAHRDVTPITAADDGALAEHARMRRVAAE